MSTHPLVPGPTAGRDASRSGARSDLPRLDYAGVTRRPGRAWWRMPLSLVLVLALWVGLNVLLMIGFSVASVLFDRTWDWWLDAIFRDPLGPVGFLLNNLSLAALVPSVVLANRIGQRIGMGFTHSVAGRWRWGWFGQTIVLLLPLILLYAGVGVLVVPEKSSVQHPQLLAMLVVVWLTTPLQCAGEEYAFRGWFLQNIGGLFARRVAAWLVPTVISTALFAVIHRSLDPWILTDLALFAIGVSVMTWRTGGLEAAVALHTLNNMVVINLGLFIGGFEESIIDSSTTGSAAAAAYALVFQSAAVSLVWWWAKRRRIQQYTTGPTRPQRRRAVSGHTESMESIVAASAAPTRDETTRP